MFEKQQYPDANHGAGIFTYIYPPKIITEHVGKSSSTMVRIWGIESTPNSTRWTFSSNPRPGRLGLGRDGAGGGTHGAASLGGGQLPRLRIGWGVTHLGFSWISMGVFMGFYMGLY